MHQVVSRVIDFVVLVTRLASDGVLYLVRFSHDFAMHLSWLGLGEVVV